MANSLPKVPVSGGIDQIAQLFQAVSPLFGTGKQTTTDGGGSSSRTTSTGKISLPPELTDQIDALMKSINDSGSPEAMDAMIQNIFSNAKEQFSPIIGQSKAAGAYNDSTLKMLGENAMAKATGEAATARINALQNSQKLSAQLADAKLSSATQLAIKSAPVTETATQAPSSKVTQTSASPLGKVLGLGTAGLQGFSLLKKLKGAGSATPTSFPTTGFPDISDNINDNIAQVMSPNGNVVGDAIGLIDNLPAITSGAVGNSDISSFDDFISTASNLFGGADTISAGTDLASAGLDLTGASNDIASNFEDFISPQGGDTSWLDDISSLFDFADGGSVGQRKKQLDLRTRLSSSRDPLGYRGQGDNNPDSNTINLADSGGDSSVSANSNGISSSRSSGRRKILEGSNSANDGFDGVDQGSGVNEIAGGNFNAKSGFALAQLALSLMTGNPVGIASAMTTLISGKSPVTHVLDTLTGKNSEIQVGNMPAAIGPLAGDALDANSANGDIASVQVGTQADQAAIAANPTDSNFADTISSLAESLGVDLASPAGEALSAAISDGGMPAADASTGSVGYDAGSGAGADSGSDGASGADAGGIDYAEGGKINGRGTTTSDSNQINVSDDEFIVPADVVAVPGVEEFLNELIQKHHTPARKAMGIRR